MIVDFALSVKVWMTGVRSTLIKPRLERDLGIRLVFPDDDNDDNDDVNDNDDNDDDFTRYFETLFPNARIEVISERKAMEVGISNVQKLKLKCLKISDEVYDACRLALEVVVSETVWQQKQRLKRQASGTYDSSRPNLLLIQGPAYEILFTPRPRDWMEQFLTHEGYPKGPALVLSIGSNLIISLVGWKYRDAIINLNW